jgi:hypothetical protein
MQLGGNSSVRVLRLLMDVIASQGWCSSGVRASDRNQSCRLDELVRAESARLQVGELWMHVKPAND